MGPLRAARTRVGRFSLALIVLACSAGTASAAFIVALDWATHARETHASLLWLLPGAGLAVAAAYRLAGAGCEQGSGLIFRAINAQGKGVPTRMAPLVFVCSTVSHLFGASVGREGGSVQIAGALGAGIASRLGLGPHETRLILIASIAAGFGAVFGTPAAGAVFAIEVLCVGQKEWRALPVACIGAYGAAFVSHLWGIRHPHYAVDVSLLGLPTSPSDWLKLFGAAVGIGLGARLFVGAGHKVAHLAKRHVKDPLLRNCLGGCTVVALVLLLHTRDYLGLGVYASPEAHSSLLGSFAAGGAARWAWLWKIVFTSVSLGTGYRGGEVMPAFFTGATLGHSLGLLLGAPVQLVSRLGMVALLGGATKTPLACSILAAELFGMPVSAAALLTCYVAYLFSGPASLYDPAQAKLPIIGWRRVAALVGWQPAPVSTRLPAFDADRPALDDVRPAID